MIYAKTQGDLTLLLSVQYTYNKNVEYDYSNQPRPCHNFVFMLDGEALIQSSGKSLSLKRGDILFIPKNTTYNAKWKATPKAIFHSVHFSFQNKSDPLFNKSAPIQLLDNTNFEKLYNLVKEIERYQFSEESDFFLALSAFYALLGQTFSSVQFEKTKPIHKTLSPAVNYIQKNYQKPLTVEMLAKLCNLSPSRFYFLFKQHTGDSPIVYKNRITIQNCAQELLINKEITIKEIAVKYGFISSIYFERLFKKIMGETPTKYRKGQSLI